jgi:hypothetical protein
MGATRDIVTQPRHRLGVGTLTAGRVAELPGGRQIPHRCLRHPIPPPSPRIPPWPNAAPNRSAVPVSAGS